MYSWRDWSLSEVEEKLEWQCASISWPPSFSSKCLFGFLYHRFETKQSVGNVNTPRKLIYANQSVATSNCKRKWIHTSCRRVLHGKALRRGLESRIKRLQLVAEISWKNRIGEGKGDRKNHVLFYTCVVILQLKSWRSKFHDHKYNLKASLPTQNE